MAKKDESAPTPPAKKPKAQQDLPLDQEAEPALDKVPDPDWYAGEYEDEDETPPLDDDRPLTTGDFHNIAQKQIMNAVFATLADSKMSWEVIEPFLAAARDVLLGDIEETAQVRLHTVHEVDGAWVEADEAYLGISVSDRDEGDEWLSDTWWLSEIATADDDPEQVRATIAALHKTIAKLDQWLKDKGALPYTPPAPTA
jgi:hypothetical protein